METTGKNQYLSDCLEKIEKKLGWGESGEWSSYDFEKLSDKIGQRTDMKLSANTLKRVWGRLDYASDPSTTTLNILAQYLGFEDWRNFITTRENKKERSYPIRLEKMFLVAIPILIFFALFYILFSGSSFLEKESNQADFGFSSKKISDGIPNSVVFKYSTPPYIDEGDKLEIQQSWDESKRHSILNTDSIATSIYYSPGYFMAKLVANDAVVREHGLLIPSNGWLGILGKGKSAIYLREDEIFLNDRIGISDSILKERPFGGNRNHETNRIYYVKDFQDFYSNNFTIEMVIGNRGRNACKTASLTVYCEGQVIIVPLATKGCVSEINLTVMDKFISGKTNDLSNFGVDMNEDITIKLSSKNGQLVIFINEVKARSIKLEKNNLRSISGIRYKFEGSGSINRIIIRNEQQVFLSE